MRDGKREIGKEIAWYLYITELFSLTFFNSISTHRTLRVRSEDLFSKSPTTFAKLTELAPDLLLNYQVFKEVFSTPKNKKDQLTMYSKEETYLTCQSMKNELDRLRSSNTNSYLKK